jgi:hypothetical protein
VVLTATPTVISVNPDYGVGGTQTFLLAYSGGSTYPLGWVQMLIAAAADGGGQPFCFLHYDRGGNGLWLYGGGNFFVGPVTPGTVSNTLQNSFCAIDTEHSYVAGNGNDLNVFVQVIFKAAGTRKIYMRALNIAGMETGWVEKGQWTAAAAPTEIMTLAPGSGTGPVQTFQLMYPAPSGFEGISFGWVQFLIAAASNGGGQPFCFLHYDRGGNGLWMYSSDSGFFLGPVSPGTPSTLLNSSACSINTAGTTVSYVGGNLVLNVPVTMKAQMSGAKQTFMRTLDVLTRDTGWVPTGTWTIP